MKLPIDILSGNYKKPRFFLCDTDKEKICQLETTDTQGNFKFNGLSELSFEVSRFFTDEITGEIKVNQYYSKIEAFRLIYIESFGYFELQGPEIVGNGLQESKICKAYSLEYTLSTKYIEEFYINTGKIGSVEVTYAEEVLGDINKIEPVTLYNPNNKKLSLLHLALEKAYGWSIGHVDPSLKTLSRQFEIERESIYDFLINEVCKKFNCYMVFDTINNKINIYAESLTAKFIGDGVVNGFTISPPFAEINTVSVDGYKTTRWEYNNTTGLLVLEDTPASGARIEVIDGALTAWETDVFVSFDNLAQEININYDSDNIKTVLTVTYGDEGTIREVNLGLPYLTDISYYYTVDWMGQDLYDAYTAYLQKNNKSQTEYTENAQKILELQNEISTFKNRLSLVYGMDSSVNPQTIGTYYVISGGKYPNYTYEEKTLPGDYNANDVYYMIDGVNVTEEKVHTLYSAIRKYFITIHQQTEPEIKDIATKDGTYEELLEELTEMKSFDFVSDEFEILKASLTPTASADEATSAVKAFLDIIWTELGSTPLEQLYLKPYQGVQVVNIEAGYSQVDNEHYWFYYPVTIIIDTLNNAINKRKQEMKPLETELSNIQKENADITNGLLMSENFTEKQLNRLSAFLREDELVLDDIIETDLDDIDDAFKVKQDAMESGMIELQKLCQPQLQFSMTMANIYAIPEFDPIINQFQLGKVIRVALRPDYVKQSRLLQININFDDFSDFSCEFGELTDLRSQSDIHADLLSNAITAGKSVATNASYWTKGADQATSTDLKIQQGLLDATTQIKSIDGTQGIVIDKYGIRLQKVDPNTGEIDPHQTWMVNNMILMSDDGFTTSRSALGQLTIEGNEYYGIIAEMMLAGYIEGSKIVGGEIYSANYIKGTQGTYINLNEGDFELGSGKICYNSDDNSLRLNGVTIDWNSTDAPSTSNIEGLEEHLNQLDGRIQTYSQSDDPSSSWEESDYDNHSGDIWFNPDDGLTRMWNGSSWEVVTDSELTELAQSKAQIFTSTPTTPYYVGDLWVQGSTGDIMHCVRERTEDESFNESDWEKSSKYTDDTTAQEALRQAKQAIEDAAQGINLAEAAQQSAEDARDYADSQDTVLSTNLTGAYQDYTNSQVSKLDNAVGNYLGLGGSTLIGSDYVVSPYIGGGYLNITNTNNSSRVIIDPNNLTKTDYIFQIHNGKKITLGVDKNGNATFSGIIQWDSNNSPDISNVTGLSDYLDDIETQLDGCAQTWYQSTDPSSAWNTNDLKKLHVGDIWFNTTSKKSYIYNSSYTWSEADGVPDEVFDAIDGKSTIYVSKPSKQEQGDLLIPNATFTSTYSSKTYTFTKQKTYRCSTTSSSFRPDYWNEIAYTDDTIANQALEKAKQGIIDAANGISLANTAQSTANTAQQTANNAQQAANNAQQAASNAETNAINHANTQDAALSTRLTEAYQKYTNTKVSELDTAVGNYLGLSNSTLIGSNYVVSPYIGGGYLNITNTSNNSRVIIDPNNLTGNNYIFQVHNGSKVSVGIDKNGNAIFDGAITATSLTIANNATVTGLNTSDLNNDSGYQTSSGVTTIINNTVTTDYINALSISADRITSGTLNADVISVSGKFKILNDGTEVGSIGYMTGSDGSQTTNGVGFSAGSNYLIVTDGGVRFHAEDGTNSSDFYVAPNAAAFNGNRFNRGGIRNMIEFNTSLYSGSAVQGNSITTTNNFYNYFLYVFYFSGLDAPIIVFRNGTKLCGMNGSVGSSSSTKKIYSVNCTITNDTTLNIVEAKINSGTTWSNATITNIVGLI